MTPDQLERSDIALRSIGFQPSKVTNERARQWAERRASTAMDERRRDFCVKISQSLADEHRARERGDEKVADAARAKAMSAFVEIAEHRRRLRRTSESN